MEDQFLIEQVLKGNKNAFKMLVIRYQRPLFSFFRKFGFSSQKNEELTQEVFLKSFQYLSSFDFIKGTFSSWIFSIAKNMAMNEFKKKSEVFVTEKTLEGLSVSKNEEMEKIIELKTSREAVHKMLPRIPNPFKIPVILSYIQELSLDEIAVIEKCSVGTVKSRIFRGKLLLRDLLIKETISPSDKEHVLNCQKCSKVAFQMEQLDSLILEEQIDLPENFDDNVMKKIIDSEKSNKTQSLQDFWVELFDNSLFRWGIGGVGFLIAFSAH